MNCIICDEKFNKTKHFKVKCLHCNFEACRECCKKFILINEYTSCMNPQKNENGELECNKEWTRKFMLKNFTKKFINIEWKHMLQNVCFNNEKQLLPETMNYLKQEKEKNIIRKEIADVSLIIRELKEKRDNLNIMLRNGGNMIDRKHLYNKSICADAECKGYLNDEWKCGICEKYTCNNCNVLKPLYKPDTHICDDDDVATFKLLTHTTKPCPKCNALIYKIDGCDQMWCTECHTAFSWHTGNIETRVHNPHYYEWQRQQNDGIIPREYGDMECGRDIVGINGQHVIFYITNECFKFLMQKLEKENNFADKIKNLKSRFRQLNRIYVRMVNFQTEELNTYIIDENMNNQDIRARYLNNSISECRFKQLLQQRKNNYLKKREIYTIGNLLLITFIDIVYRFRYEWKDYREKIEKDSETIAVSIDEHMKFIDKYFNEIIGIVKYCNELLMENKETYGGKGLIIMIYDIANANMNQRVNYNIFQKIK